MTEKLEVELTFEDESMVDVTAALSDVRAESVQPRQARGLVGIETVLTCIIIVEESARLISWLVKSWKSGVLVVVDPSRKVSAEKNSNIPRGSVIMVSPDGTQVTLKNPDGLQISDWFKEVFKAILGQKP